MTIYGSNSSEIKITNIYCTHNHLNQASATHGPQLACGHCNFFLRTSKYCDHLFFEYIGWHNEFNSNYPRKKETITFVYEPMHVYYMSI